MSCDEPPPSEHSVAREDGERPDLSWPAVNAESREWVPAAAMGIRAARAGTRAGSILAAGPEGSVSEGA